MVFDRSRTSTALLLAAAAVACASRVLAAQQIVRWDTSVPDQAGQRSLFLRTPNGGARGLPLGAGDVDGDGRDDILLCAFSAGEATLFFSPSVIAGQQEGLPQAGVVTRIGAVQSLGVECAAGDVNGDGLADLVLGAPNVDPGGHPGAGTVYVVFGSSSLPAQIDVTSSPGVLAIPGIDAGDHLGVWVDAVDVDGDGVEDLLLGAPDADGPGNSRPEGGEAYVVYGGPDLVPGSVQLATLAAGGRLFTVLGGHAGDKAGSALHAGQIDGEGTADLAIGLGLNRAAVVVFSGGVGGADGPDGTRSNAGGAAIVFDPARGGTTDLADPPDDTAVVFGADPGDFAGEEVNVGDADGDGFGDLLIGALTADGPDNLREAAGEAYLVYGGRSLHGARIDLREPPDGVTTIFGPSAGTITGDSARFIDIDGDGRGDVFIGCPSGTFIGPDGRGRTGALFFIRSPAGHLPAVIDLDHPPVATLPFGVILAADPGDILSYSLIKADADADPAEDVVVNAMTGDGLNNLLQDAGEAYVLGGATLSAALAPFATGDLDGDGRSDLRDLQQAIAALIGRGHLTDVETRAADVNGNGSLDEGDLVGLLDRVLDRNLLVPGGIGVENIGDYDYDVSPAFEFDLPRGAAARIGPQTVWSGMRGSAGSTTGDWGWDPPAAEGAAFSLVEPARAGGPETRWASESSATATGAAAASGAGRSSGSVPLGALQATFALSVGSAVPRVVPMPGADVTTYASDGELRVLVLAADRLPVGVPLFRVVGATPRVSKVTAATRGGSLRSLDRAGPGTSGEIGAPGSVAGSAR